MKATSETMEGRGKRRRGLFSVLAVFMTLAGCMKPASALTLDVVTFNYLDRFIFDVFIDGKSGDSSTPYPETGGSTISGVKLREGPKQVTWTLGGKRGRPRNGEVVTAKNPLELRNVPKDAVFLAIHIYPDETVELITSRHYPQPTAKGEAMALAAPSAERSPSSITGAAPSHTSPP